jgi:hypothetical protein
MRPLACADHQKIRADVSGQLRELAGRSAHANVNAYCLTFEPAEDLDLLLEVLAQLASKALRFSGTRPLWDHMNDVEVAPGDTTRDPSGLVERKSASFGEVVADDDRKHALVIRIHGSSSLVLGVLGVLGADPSPTLACSDQSVVRDRPSSRPHEPPRS